MGKNAGQGFENGAVGAGYVDNFGDEAALGSVVVLRKLVKLSSQGLQIGCGEVDAVLLRRYLLVLSLVSNNSSFL
jgi:hypothetical protein